MKRIKSFAAIVAASLTLASCGFGTTGQTATTNNGTALGGDVLQQAGVGILGTILGNILGGATTQQSLVGSWTYAGPKLVFESENVLSQIGGQVLSNNIEQKLGTYLEKMGFKAGKSVLTFGNDGNCSFALGSRTLPGTYSYDQKTNKLTLNGLFVTGQLPCTVTVQNGQLLMLFDADKLLSIATAVGSKGSSSLGSILGSYKGLKLGWAMNR